MVNTNVIDVKTNKLVCYIYPIGISNALHSIITKYNLPSHNTKIVFDNGAENNVFTNIVLAQYPSITKIIAKLDTPHANNIVEACHKRYKNEILPIKHFETFTELQDQLLAHKDAYNNMPHSHLQGQTPNEASHGIPFAKNEYLATVQANKATRKLANQAIFCCRQ